MIKFHFLTGDVDWQTYGGKWISNKLNNGEFDYWLVMEVINWYDAVGKNEAPAKYHINVCVVVPSEATQFDMDRALDCCGLTFKDIQSDEAKVEVLHTYGIYAVVWQENGNNIRKLLKEAHKQAHIQGDFLFGFAMDRPQNAIGSTGWDLIKGNLLAGLDKYENQ